MSSNPVSSSKTKTPLSSEEYQKAKDKSISVFRGLIQSWKNQQAGDMNSWIQLLEQIMQHIQSSHKIPGTQKMSLAMDILQGLAQILIDENVANLSESQMQVVKSILSEQGLSILSAATSVIKRVMVSLDANDDGEISIQECFPCCFGKSKNRKK